MQVDTTPALHIILVSSTDGGRDLTISTSYPGTWLHDALFGDPEDLIEAVRVFVDSKHAGSVSVETATLHHQSTPIYP